MSTTFDKLKAILEEKKELSNDEVEKMVAEHGEMSDDEKFWLESERHKLKRDGEATISMDEYLQAAEILDSPDADPSSEAYQRAEEIVNKYESGL